MNNYDSLQRFIFEDTHIRGEIIQLSTTYQEIIHQHDYPLALQRYLGQVLVITGLLAASIKHQGGITLQIRGDGAIPLLVAQCDPALHLRALAQWDEELTGDFHHDFGQGNLVITIEAENAKKYQGIVPLNREINNLTQAIELYFMQSEQLATKIWLSTNQHTAAGLFLQHLPHENTSEEDFWQHLTHISQTIRAEELLDLSFNDIIKRLYHSEDIRLFDPQNVSFKCRCSPQIMGEAIMVLGEDDVHALLLEQEVIQVACKFCNTKYDFGPDDIEQLLALHASSDDSITKH